MTSSPRQNIDMIPLASEAGGFDLDAWLDGSRPPEKIAVVYGRGDLAAEYDALDDELRAVRNARVDGPGAAMMNSTGQSREREITDRMTEVREELLASKLVVRFRALSKDAQDEIVTGAQQIPDAERVTWRAEQYVMAAAIRPQLTLEQVRKLRDKVGEGQFVALFEAAFEVSNDRQVEVPFSLQHSASVATQRT